MDLVVGTSESAVKSLLGKLCRLLAQEYTLIRGVAGDLQYISDELRTMQCFLGDLGGTSRVKQDKRMKDWIKQIRDLTYDIEDCIDYSSQRIHTPSWLRSDICCYFLVNSAYEIVTWWPRRDIASQISGLMMRAQQISERRQRYGVNNPETMDNNLDPVEGFDAAGDQDTSLELVAVKDPVGVDEYIKELESWVTDKANKAGVLSIVGYEGVGKTSIATALYKKLEDQFDCCAMVTVSQSSNIEANLDNIRSQVNPKSSCQERRHGTFKKNGLAAACQACKVKSGEAGRTLRPGAHA